MEFKLFKLRSRDAAALKSSLKFLGFEVNIAFFVVAETKCLVCGAGSDQVQGFVAGKIENDVLVEFFGVNRIDLLPRLDLPKPER